MNRKCVSLRLGGPAARSVVAGVALLVGLSFAGQAKAALMLTLSEPGFAPSTVPDADSDGVVQFVGAYGDFKTNIVVGFSNKLDPGGSSALLQVQSLDITKNTGLTTTPAVLTVTVSDTGFTFPSSPGSSLNLFSSMGGTLTGAASGDSIKFQSFVDPGGLTPGPQTYVSPGGSAPASFDVPDANMTFVRGASYDLHNVTTISLTNGNESSNLSGTTNVSAVPEPSTAVLALGGAALMLNRRRRARSK